ncbi:MAG: hypothetical protein ACPIOQ_58890 [Promethearchaeia archaeon]
MCKQIGANLDSQYDAGSGLDRQMGARRGESTDLLVGGSDDDINGLDLDAIEAGCAGGMAAITGSRGGQGQRDAACAVRDGVAGNKRTHEESRVTGSRGGEGGSDDELEVTGHEGHLALIDFPHPREHCVAHPFGSQAHCARCFCVVCDVQASQCQQWPDHCRMTFREFKKMRHAQREQAEARAQPTDAELRPVFDALVAQPGFSLESISLRSLALQIETRLGLTAGTLSKASKQRLKAWALEEIEEETPVIDLS